MAIERIIALFLIIPLLVACSGWLGERDGKPLPGKRISVMSLERRISPDPSLSGLSVRLPPPYSNPQWPQAGGMPNHSMHHLSAKGPLHRIWDTDIGNGSNGDAQLIASPIISQNCIYTLDVSGTVQALDVETGRQIWRIRLRAKNEGDDDQMTGGGIALGDGKIFVSTGYAEVIALEAANGRELWRRTLNGPMRAAPTIFKGRVFVITIANELYALDAKDGGVIWTHVGIAENAGLLGGASPAAEGSIIIASYSSGEIVAMRVENGRVAWSDTLTALRRTDPVSTLAHVRGRAVIDRDRVFVSSNSGRTVALDLRTGSRIWEKSIGSAYGPWVAGNFIYVLSNHGELVCLTRKNGGVRWVTALQKYEDEEDKEGAIYWSGPVVVGDRVLVGSSHGKIWSVSPYNGRLLGKLDVGSAVYMPAIVAKDRVYILTDDANLVALR